LINFKFALIFALEFKTLEFKRTFIINNFIILNNNYNIGTLLGMGIGDWGLGIGNPQSPIPIFYIIQYVIIILIIFLK